MDDSRNVLMVGSRKLLFHRRYGQRTRRRRRRTRKLPRRFDGCRFGRWRLEIQYYRRRERRRGRGRRNAGRRRRGRMGKCRHRQRRRYEHPLSMSDRRLNVLRELRWRRKRRHWWKIHQNLFSGRSYFPTPIHTNHRRKWRRGRNRSIGMLRRNRKSRLSVRDGQLLIGCLFVT
ncbi:MAG: hypothetical protein QG650_699 [Patescibacteria group bacterium]|nr:hypothetical protein [Patescibacteria group bacterium]